MGRTPRLPRPARARGRWAGGRPAGCGGCSGGDGGEAATAEAGRLGAAGQRRPRRGGRGGPPDGALIAARVEHGGQRAGDAEVGGAGGRGTRGPPAEQGQRGGPEAVDVLVEAGGRPRSPLGGGEAAAAPPGA